MQVWDVSQQKCEHTLRHHSNKVQAVAWNPVEAPVLLTGSFDKTACLVGAGNLIAAPAYLHVSSPSSSRDACHGAQAHAACYYSPGAMHLQ
jgi:periodic tryptophan protein 1